jgi:hypothetical protein
VRIFQDGRFKLAASTLWQQHGRIDDDEDGSNYRNIEVTPGDCETFYPKSEQPKSLRENSRHMIVSALIGIIEEFVRHSAKLAEMAGTQWADDNDLCQPCHWLNETSKEARQLIDSLNNKTLEREQQKDAVEAGA